VLASAWPVIEEVRLKAGNLAIASTFLQTGMPVPIRCGCFQIEEGD
jgi:hypothetical protein